MKDSAKTFGLFLCVTFIGLVLALARPGAARAETTVIVEPSSAGGMLVSAGNLLGVKSGEIRLDYVTDGPAAVPNVVALANNTQATLTSTGANSGTVIITITGRNPANGYVNLARINVVDQDGNPGRIVSPYYARFTRNNGGQETASVAITNPTPADRKPDATKTAEAQKTAIDEAVKKQQQQKQKDIAGRQNGDTPAAGTSGPDAGGRSRETVVLVASASQPPPSAAPAKLAPPVFRRVEGVLDRFLSHSGVWSPDVIMWLFAPVTSQEFRQDPAVLIADGLTEVRVSVRSFDMADVVNCLVVRGGQVTSVQSGEAGEWLLNIIPRLGALAVTVTVQTEKSIIEYPLTVTPPLELFDAAAASPGLAQFVRAANEMARTMVK